MDQDISLGHQAGISVATVFIIDWLKKSAWFPWINNNTETINKIVSLSVALFTAAGLKIVSHEGSISAGGIVTIAVPPISVVLDTILHAAGQFGGQEVLHKLLGNHVMSKAMLDKVNAIEQSVKSIQGEQK